MATPKVYHRELSIIAFWWFFEDKASKLEKIEVSIHFHPCRLLQQTTDRKQLQCRDMVLNNKTRPLFCYSIDVKTKCSFLKMYQIAWHSPYKHEKLSENVSTSGRKLRNLCDIHHHLQSNYGRNWKWDKQRQREKKLPLGKALELSLFKKDGAMSAVVCSSCISQFQLCLSTSPLEGATTFARIVSHGDQALAYTRATPGVG